MIEPFLLRALLAAIGLAIVAAPLGSLVVWNRMAYFGETVAQASLIGIALALAFDMNLTVSVVLVTLAVAALLIALSQQKLVPLDSILGLMHHGALALGVIATSMLRGPTVDLMGYLFGDIYAVTTGDLYWIYGGGLLVLAVLSRLWQPLLRLAVHEDLAAAEGVDRGWVKALFIVLLAVTIAIAIKIVGALLIIAFLDRPGRRRPAFSATPERMVIVAGLVAVASVVAGLSLSATIDAPGGPAIVLVMALVAGLSLALASWKARS